MENSYKKSFEITNSMLDKNDFLKFKTILDLVQRTCEIHADDLNIGFETMLKKGLIWVVVQNEITMFKNVKNPHTIEVETFILKNKFVEYPRESHIIFDGEVIGVVRSIWVILDAKDFSLQAPNIYEAITPYENQLITGRIPRIKIFKKEELEVAETVKVKYSQIDHNNHLNNIYYADFFMDAFKENTMLKTMWIEYIKQAFLDDELTLYKYVDGLNCYLYGYKGDEKIFAIKGEKYEN